MKRGSAIIIHAWDSSPSQHWYKEEKANLEKSCYKVALPEMPGGLWPKLKEWLKIIWDFKPDDETILIGHSLGAPAILRYLEIAEKPVDKVFLVAAFARNLGFEETRNFVEKPFNWQKIRQNARKFYIINETNDPYVPIVCGKEIADALGGEFTEVDGNIHFDKMDLNLINGNLNE